MIAYRFIPKQSDYIYSSDSDFAASIGPRCVMIKDVMIEKKKNVDANFTLAKSSNEIMNALRQTKVGNDNDNHIKWEKAKYAFFE